MKKVKVFTLGQLKALKIGTKLRLVDNSGFGNSNGMVNSITGKIKNGFILEVGALQLPQKKEFESWDGGFIIKKGANTSIPTMLKYEVYK